MATDTDMDIDMEIDMNLDDNLDPEIARLQAEADAINAVRTRARLHEGRQLTRSVSSAPKRPLTAMP